MTTGRRTSPPMRPPVSDVMKKLKALVQAAQAWSASAETDWHCLEASDRNGHECDSTTMFDQQKEADLAVALGYLPPDWAEQLEALTAERDELIRKNELLIQTIEHTRDAQKEPCDHGCVICGQENPGMPMHVINGLHYHHDCAEDRSNSDVCPECADADELVRQKFAEAQERVQPLVDKMKKADGLSAEAKAMRFRGETRDG